jgi:hypothetical protein
MYPFFFFLFLKKMEPLLISYGARENLRSALTIAVLTSLETYLVKISNTYKYVRVNKSTKKRYLAKILTQVCVYV